MDENELKSLTTELHKQKYPDANVIFLAGSVIRGVQAPKEWKIDLN